MRETIKFLTTHPPLLGIDEVLPKPGKHYYPQWFKNMPKMGPYGEVTARNCPAFPDYFDQGIVIPAWTDMMVYYSSQTGEWIVDTPEGNDYYSVTNHGNEQLIDYTTPVFHGQVGKFIFKLNSPWKIITPRGWSVYQLPMFYEFEKDYTVMPGIIDTDIFHEINFQLLYLTDEKEVFIKRGTPLVQYVPFKRNKPKYQIGTPDEKDIKRISTQKDMIIGKFVPSGYYRKMQKKRDKNEG